MGINNLYTAASPVCNGGNPWVSFAYNTVTQTGGQIRTSPALSEDGAKTAFVESTATGSFFHVLVLPNPIPAPPSQTGTVAQSSHTDVVRNSDDRGMYDDSSHLRRCEYNLVPLD